MAIVRWIQGLRRRWQVAIGVVVGLVLIGALTPSSPTPAETVGAPVTASPTQAATRTPAPAKATPAPTVTDAVGRRACSDFAKLASDIQVGVVAPNELRPRVQTIYDSGRYSEHPGIAEHSTALLRGTTSNDAATVSAATDGLIAACSPR